MINRSQLGRTTMIDKRRKVVKGHDRRLNRIRKPRPISAGEKRVMEREGKAAKTIIKNIKKYSQKNPALGPHPLKKKKGKSLPPRRKTLLKVRKSMNKGGKSNFGMLSVKAGIDKNPNPTKADRIAGATSRKPLAKGGGSDTHVTKDGRTVKKGLYYYMNRAKKRGTSRKGKGTVTDKALARSAKTAKKPVKKKKA